MHILKTTRHYVFFKEMRISNIYKHTRMAAYGREEKWSWDQDERRGNKQEGFQAWIMVITCHQLRNMINLPNIKIYIPNSVSFLKRNAENIC